ncbi:MAG: bifunctional DNA primase/helicase [Mariniphaga sp.]|nr:bifunctional DNA primase/helicase [Mariniphaga sp.]
MLNTEEILSRTGNGLSVFKHYITTEWRVGRNFLNPLYEDSKASCNIYFDRSSNCYRFKDFGNDAYSGDCFFFVGMLKGLDCRNSQDFVEILQIINRDLSLALADDEYATPVKHSVKQPKPEPISPPKSKPYSIIAQPFTAKDLSFWQQYGITSEILKTFKVVSVKKFESENKDGNPFSFTYSEQEPMFAYQGRQNVKIYRPFSQVRFLYGGNVENYCFGLEQLPAKGDTLFITGGEKDVMSLSVHGFNAISFNSETTHINQSIIRKLSYMYKHIVLLYDMDKTGQDASLKHQQQLSEFGVKRLLLPIPGTKESKDISDFFRLGNEAEELTRLFLDLLELLYNDTLSILKSCEVNLNNPPMQSKMIVSINDVPLGTQGNLLCITGGEGTGKSNFAASLIAGAIRDCSVSVDTLGVEVAPNTRQRAILLYDTEQSEVQLYKNTINILRRAKLREMPQYMKVYNLTGMSRKQRLQSIVESMDKFYFQFNGIHLVIIDGIADLIRGANDEQESISLVEELYRLAGIYNTCIVCVLHFIPNGMKLRGHLGSELQRKAAAILSIEQDNDPALSVVKALKVRDGSPLDVPLIQFGWDKQLGMHTYCGEKPKEEKEKRKENELTEVARNIFNRQNFATYVDLCEQIQELLDVKDRTAKSYIKFMREKEIILKDPSNSSYFIIGHL